MKQSQLSKPCTRQHKNRVQDQSVKCLKEEHEILQMDGILLMILMVTQRYLTTHRYKMKSATLFYQKRWKQQSKHWGWEKSSGADNMSTELDQAAEGQAMVDILTSIISRLQPQVEEITAEEQAGFRAGRSTTEQIFSLGSSAINICSISRISTMTSQTSRRLLRVWQEAFWARINVKTLRVVENLYEKAKSAVLFMVVQETSSELQSGPTRVSRPTLTNPL